MAYGYGSWSQVTAPSTSSSASAAISGIGKAGDLFNKAVEAARQGVTDYQTAETNALSRAQDTNLTNLQLRLAEAAQQGLDQYGQLQQQYTPQGIQNIYGKNIDAIKAAELTQLGRDQAVESTISNLKSKYLTDYNTQLQTNAQAYEQASALAPDTAQFIGIDAANNVGFKPEAFDAAGKLLPEAEAARIKFGEVASKFGWTPEDPAFQARQKSTEYLSSIGAKPTEIDKVNAELENYRATRTNLPADLQATLDSQVANLTTLRDSQLDVIRQNKEDILSTAQMSLAGAEAVSKYLNNPDPLKAFIKENYPDSTWFTPLWRDAFGGQDAYEVIQGIINELPADKRPTDSQILIAAAQAGEMEGPYIFGLGAQGINPEEFRANILAAANNALGTNESAIKNRLSALNNAVSREQEILANYNAGVSSARRRIAADAGLQDLKGNTAFLKDVYRNFERITGSAPTTAEKKTLDAAVNRVSKGEAPTIPNATVVSPGTPVTDLPPAGVEAGQTETKLTVDRAIQEAVRRVQAKKGSEQTSQTALDRSLAALRAAYPNNPESRAIAAGSAAQSLNQATLNNLSQPVSDVERLTGIASGIQSRANQTANELAYPTTRVRQSTNDELTGFEAFTYPQVEAPVQQRVQPAQAPALNEEDLLGPLAADVYSGRGNADNQITRAAQRITSGSMAGYQQPVAPPTAQQQQVNARAQLLTASLSRLPTAELQRLLQTSLDAVTKQVIANILSNR